MDDSKYLMINADIITDNDDDKNDQETRPSGGSAVPGIVYVAFFSLK